jgi:hypothetical protein
LAKSRRLLSWTATLAGLVLPFFAVSSSADATDALRCSVPDVTGYTYTGAVAEFKNSQIAGTMAHTGSGFVHIQRPKPLGQVRCAAGVHLTLQPDAGCTVPDVRYLSPENAKKEISRSEPRPARSVVVDGSGPAVHKISPSVGAMLGCDETITLTSGNLCRVPPVEGYRLQDAINKLLLAMFYAAPIGSGKRVFRQEPQALVWMPCWSPVKIYLRDGPVQ